MTNVSSNWFNRSETWSIPSVGYYMHSIVIVSWLICYRHFVGIVSSSWSIRLCRRLTTIVWLKPLFSLATIVISHYHRPYDYYSHWLWLINSLIQILSVSPPLPFLIHHSSLPSPTYPLLSRSLSLELKSAGDAKGRRERGSRVSGKGWSRVKGGDKWD